jgi:Cys-rich repeat protein
MSEVGRSRRKEDETRPLPSLVIIVIVAIIVLVLIVFLIAWLTTRTTPVKVECTLDSQCGSGKICRDTKCISAPVCTSPPAKPSNVQAVYDRNAGTATLTWVGATGSTGYKVYRKLDDPTVSKNNSDQVLSVTTPTVSANFVSLPVGSNYFVVTSINSCGESDESIPVVIVPSCSAVPTQPPAPALVLDADECAGPGFVEYVNINHVDATGPRPFNLFTGTGQADIEDYLWINESPSVDPTVALECTGTPVAYEVTHISNADYANLVTPTGPLITTASLQVTWEPVLNAEEYTVSLVCVTANSVGIFVGGTVAAPATSLTVATPTGTQLVFAQVVGYRLCDKSSASNSGYHIPPTI